MALSLLRLLTTDLRVRTASEQFALIDIPARFVIRDYLRAQRDSLGQFQSSTQEGMGQKWMTAYRKPIRRARILELAGDFKDVCLKFGGFGFETRYEPPTRASPYREKGIVSGFFIKPMALGQNWLLSEAPSFTENAITVEFCKASFGSKRMSHGFGFTGIVLTQHVLERIYERTEVHRDHFENLIHSNLSEFIGGVSIAETVRLWNCNDDERTRVSAIPYSNGLMILRSRLLIAERDEGQLGFQVLLPSGRLVVPYIAPSIYVPELLNTTGKLQGALLTCGVTYLDLGMLRNEQQDYYYAFKALQSEMSEDFMKQAMAANFAPRAPHETSEMPTLDHGYQSKVDKLGRLLKSFTKLETSDPVCCELPYDG